MRFIECLQGSELWLSSRAGLCTASRFEDAISALSRASGAKKAGDPTAVSDRYAADLAIEQISGKPHGEPPKAWILDRGHEMEKAARRLYEARTGYFVTEAGLCVDDDGFGYSSDGLVEEDGLLEIKSPIDSTKIIEMFQTGDVSEYIAQCMGGLWITGRKWIDFIYYVPDLEKVGNDLYIKRIHRDDAFIDDMVIKLALFMSRVQKYKEILSNTERK